MEQLLGEGFRCGSIGLVQMGRAPSSSRVTTGEGLNKGPWTAEEDSILTAFVRANGEGNWRILPKRAGMDLGSHSEQNNPLRIVPNRRLVGI